MGSFLPTLPFKLRGLDSYPGGALTHWFMPAFAGRTHLGTNPVLMNDSAISVKLKNAPGAGPFVIEAEPNPYRSTADTEVM
jgi:hypothetical protein